MPEHIVYGTFYSKVQNNTDLAEKLLRIAIYENDHLRLEFFDSEKKPNNKEVKITLIVEEVRR